MDFPTTVLACLCGSDTTQPKTQHVQQKYALINEKPPLEPIPFTNLSTNPIGPPSKLNQLAHKVLSTLATSPLPFGSDKTLTTSITAQAGLSPQSWTSSLAECILRGLEHILRSKNRASWGEALNDAYHKAEKFAQEEFHVLCEYARGHPHVRGMVAKLVCWNVSKA
ncbi:hypothetical protein N0V88_006332 [Collariella sp. IMI 366227]|nr:hypothetical protein N0V88_006332 [Collariella sp. IMI 366227]